MLQRHVNYASAEPPVALLPVETMGDRIRRLREAKSWRLEDLSKRLAAHGIKVSVSAISQWERGATQNIKLMSFLALVEELGTSADYLVHGPSDPSSRDASGRFRKPNAPGRTGNKP